MMRATLLKAATRRLVEACGGQESAVLIPGMTIERHQTFSEAGSLKHPDRFLRVDVAALMEADCGLPLVTQEMAKATGHVLVKLPAIARSNSPLGRITGQAMKEVAEVFSSLGTALDDETLEADEAGRVMTEIDEAIEKLLALKLQVEADAGRRK